MSTSDSFTSTNGWHVGTSAAFDVTNLGPSRAKQAAASKRHLPWANVNIIHQGGDEVEVLQVTLRVESEANVNNLLTLVGESGTLVYYEGTKTALLYSVDAREWYTGDRREVKAEFWIEV